MIVLYLTFGREVTVHQQAVFSAMTVLSRNHPRVRIVVVTDTPAYYGRLAGRVEIETITAERLREWRGTHDYVFRLKIRALQWLADRYPDRHLLYLDADTFCFGDPGRLIATLDDGHLLMHAREGALARLSTRAEQRMWRQYGGRTFAGIPVDERSIVYNAGVVGLNGSTARTTIARVLQFCDALCDDGTTYWLNEQLSMSVVLAAAAELRTANATIGHYWGNKEGWNRRIATLFTEEYLRAADVEEQLARVAALDFGSLPVYTKSSNTRNKLAAWVDRTFAKNVHAYVPRPGSAVSDLSERLTARRVHKPSSD